jgi:hypothetical protein
LTSRGRDISTIGICDMGSVIWDMWDRISDLWYGMGDMEWGKMKVSSRPMRDGISGRITKNSQFWSKSRSRSSPINLWITPQNYEVSQSYHMCGFTQICLTNDDSLRVLWGFWF